MMDDERFMTDSDGRIYRRYDDIKTKPIQRLNYDSREINRYIKKQEPVIIENLGLVDSATKWDLEYLQENIGNEEKSVYVSKTHKFMYYNASRCAVYPDFIPPNEQHNMTMTEFIRKYRTWKPGENRIYFQQILTDTVGSRIYNDFRNFKWSWLNSKKERFNWGDLTSNLLLIGQPGNVTPVHYDEQQNFFAQVHGYKRVLLFDPKFFQCLYPYPFHHPCDRQSQVDFENPDYERFPLAKHLAGYEGVVGPGDVLYIPMCWWHYIESTMDSQITTSINFWYKHQSMTLSDLRFPLKWQQKLTVSRNIEKMLGEALGDPSEVGPFLNALVNGRYTDQPMDVSEFSI